MPKLSEIDKIKNFRLLQVGESGAGKTHRSLSAAMFGPVYFIDTDDKARALSEKVPDKWKDRIQLEICRSAEDVGKCLRHLNDHASEYATIVLDTWSRWHDFAIEKHLADNKAKRVTVQGPDGQPIQQLAQQDWGAIKSANKRFLLKLLSYPCNVIVNTHVGKAMDINDRQVLTVGTTGSFGQMMPQFFAETHYLYIDLNGKNRIKAMRSNNIVANTSLPAEAFDDKGNLVADDLSVFEGTAKEIK